MTSESETRLSASGEETGGSTVIDAAPEAVMAVIADFASYPEWARAVAEAEVLEVGPDGLPATVRFVLDADVITDEYVLAYSWSKDGRSVEWRLESSTLQKSQIGSYQLVPVEQGTEVHYTLEVETLVPMLGRVRSRVERRIIGTALSELRHRVEGAGS